MATLYGTTNNDYLYGTNLNDIIYGDAGNDTIRGSAGADTIYGGAGIDTVDYSSSQAAVTVNLSTGTGSGGDAQGDTLRGIENLIGSNDRYHGDELTGDSGNNILDGGLRFRLSVRGRRGTTFSLADRADDTMSGGRDADTFVFHSSTHGIRPQRVLTATMSSPTSRSAWTCSSLQGRGVDSLGELSIRPGRERHRDHTIAINGCSSITLVGVGYRPTDGQTRRTTFSSCEELAAYTRSQGGRPPIFAAVASRRSRPHGRRLDRHAARPPHQVELEVDEFGRAERGRPRRACR